MAQPPQPNVAPGTETPGLTKSWGTKSLSGLGWLSKLSPWSNEPVPVRFPPVRFLPPCWWLILHIDSRLTPSIVFLPFPVFIYFQTQQQLPPSHAYGMAPPNAAGAPTLWEGNPGPANNMFQPPPMDFAMEQQVSYLFYTPFSFSQTLDTTAC